MRDESLSNLARALTARAFFMKRNTLEKCFLAIVVDRLRIARTNVDIVVNDALTRVRFRSSSSLSSEEMVTLMVQECCELNIDIINVCERVVTVTTQSTIKCIHQAGEKDDDTERDVPGQTRKHQINR